MDARRAALARRHHTVFIAHDTKDTGSKTPSEQEEETGEFQDDETKAKKFNDYVRQTQSMPLIADSADTSLDSCSDKDRDIPKSKEYNCVMEEVKGQREQLLVFHNRQREEELLAEEELEQGKREGDGEDDGSTMEELQPMEGMNNYLPLPMIDSFAEHCPAKLTASNSSIILYHATIDSLAGHCPAKLMALYAISLQTCT